MSIKNWNKIVAQVAKELYTGSMRPGELSTAMIEAQATYLWQAVETGFSERALGIIDTKQVALLRDNIFHFSGFKNLQQLKETSSLLVDGSGNVRGFRDFLRDVKAIDATYNERYLKAEYQLATTSAQGISQWHEYQADKHILPLLRWSAVHDARTRPSHMVLDNITLPVDHPFWKTHWIPYEWGCRCLIEQLPDGEPHTPDEKLASLPEGSKVFQFNAGVENTIFPLDKERFKTVYPYAQHATKEEAAKVNAIVATIITSSEKDKSNLTIFKSLSSKTYDKMEYFRESKGFYAVDKLHGKMELKSNLITAERLAKQGDRVILLKNEKKKKSADAMWNDEVWEFKAIANAKGKSISNAIQKHLQAATGQSDKVLIRVDQKFEVKTLFEGLEYAQKNGWMDDKKKVAFLLDGKDAPVIISPSQIKSGKYKKKFQK